MEPGHAEQLPRPLRRLTEALAREGPNGAAQSPQAVAAAVLVALFPLAGEELGIVLTRRRGDLRQHAGEISFPGGRREEADADLVQTALREAEEEIGLASSDVRVLGGLAPTSTFATNYEIWPFVGLISSERRWTLSAREVDVVLELPLREVRSGRTRTRLERRGRSFQTDAYVIGENLIWGATARILESLFTKLDHS